MLRPTVLPAIIFVCAMIFSSTRQWLLLPWSGAVDHRLAAWAAWHGRLMVLGWAILVPLGTISARYFKIWPGQDWPRRLDDKHWWHLHRLLQTGGLVAATGGLWFACRNGTGETPLARCHALFGWIVMVLGWLQIAGGLLRGTKGGPTDPRACNGDLTGDHYDMTHRRVLFEYTHKLGGYLTLALAAIAVPIGLWIADAPRWMWILIGLWWTSLTVLAVRLQRAGCCIDTYQAIWGPAVDLPGNRLAPVGWGVTRHDDGCRP